MLLACSSWMKVLGRGGTCWLLAPMHWLLRLLARSLMDGSHPIFQSLRSLASVSGLLWSLAFVLPSPFGLPAGCLRWHQTEESTSIEVRRVSDMCDQRLGFVTARDAHWSALRLLNGFQGA